MNLPIARLVPVWFPSKPDLSFLRGIAASVKRSQMFEHVAEAYGLKVTASALKELVHPGRLLIECKVLDVAVLECVFGSGRGFTASSLWAKLESQSRDRLLPLAAGRRLTCQNQVVSCRCSGRRSHRHLLAVRHCRAQAAGELWR